MGFKRLSRWPPAKRGPRCRYIWYRFSTARAMIFTRWHIPPLPPTPRLFFSIVYNNIVSENAFDAAREFKSCRYVIIIIVFFVTIVTIIIPCYGRNGTRRDCKIAYVIVGVYRGGESGCRRGGL